MSKEKDKIKISVGVITYNQHDTIRQTLDSILCQQGDFALEVVIGEDCSPDDTYAICSEYVERYPNVVKLLPNTRNLGIMANFARVMRACTGEYIGILAGDDYWCDDHKLEKQLHFMQANPQFGVCCTSGYRLMVDTGRLVPGIEPMEPIPGGDISKFYKDRISGIYAQPLSVLFKRELLQYIDFDEYIKRQFPLEDYPMQSVWAHHTLFGHLPDRTSVYRISRKSATFTFFDNPKYMAYYSGIADIRRYLHELFPEDVPFTEEWAAEFVHHKQFLQYVWYLNYKAAKKHVVDFGITSAVNRKERKIVSNPIAFYAFALYKRIVWYTNSKSRTN